METAAFRSGRHVVSRLHVHLVFVTKHRRGVTSDRVLAHLRETMESVCSDFEAELLEMDGEDDHVHLLITYPPKVALSTLVNSLKGVSARMIRKADFPEIRGKLWGDAFWSPSYCAVSCGGAPLHIIAEYVRNQRDPRPRRSQHRSP